MTPTTRLDIFVQVRANGEWHEGFLEHWRRCGDRWEGFVRYTVGVGQTHIRWFDQDNLRPIYPQITSFGLRSGNSRA